MQRHGNGIRPMYATSSSGDVYHLLIEAETDSTLCGIVKSCKVAVILCALYAPAGLMFCSNDCLSAENAG